MVGYRSETVTRPDGTSYVQCIRIMDKHVTMTVEHHRIADQLKAWDTTE